MRQIGIKGNTSRTSVYEKREVLNYPVGTSMEILHFPLHFVFVLPKTLYLPLLILFNTLDNSATHSYQQRYLPSFSNFLYLRQHRYEDGFKCFNSLLFKSPSAQCEFLFIFRWIQH